jgi:hypothetical protein
VQILVLVAAASLVSGCRDRESPASLDPTLAHPTPPRPRRAIDLPECRALADAIDALLACPAAADEHATFADWRQVQGTSPIDADRPEAFTRHQCLTWFVRLDGAAAAAGCTLPLTNAARTWIAERRALRTPPVATGHAPLDAALAALAAQRDRACACATDECVEAARVEAGGLVYPDLGKHRPALANYDTLLGELIDCFLFPALRGPAGAN